jgi:hypothetical protein
VDEIDRLHAQALAEGKDTYRDPQTGYEVFTTTYLLRYGSCCGSACRHCPFDYDRVDPGLRELLPPPRAPKPSSPSS